MPTAESYGPSLRRPLRSLIHHPTLPRAARSSSLEESYTQKWRTQVVHFSTGLDSTHARKSAFLFRGFCLQLGGRPRIHAGPPLRGFGRAVTPRDLEVLSPLAEEIQWVRERTRSVLTCHPSQNARSTAAPSDPSPSPRRRNSAGADRPPAGKASPAQVQGRGRRKSPDRIDRPTRGLPERALRPPRLPTPPPSPAP